VSDVTEVPAASQPTCDHLHGDAGDAQSGGRDGDAASHEERKAACGLGEEDEEEAAVVVEVKVNSRKRLSKIGGRKMRWCRIGLGVAGSNGGRSMKNCDMVAAV